VHFSATPLFHLLTPYYYSLYSYLPYFSYSVALTLYSTILLLLFSLTPFSLTLFSLTLFSLLSSLLPLLFLTLLLCYYVVLLLNLHLYELKALQEAERLRLYSPHLRPLHQKLEEKDEEEEEEKDISAPLSSSYLLYPIGTPIKDLNEISVAVASYHLRDGEEERKNRRVREREE
jgi:hypothetical protein